MSGDEPLKSAYELALERLRAQDRRAGLEESRPLSARQKKRIAELRQNAKAKLAELMILHKKHLAEAEGDPAKIEELEEQLRIDRRRVESTLEDDVARIKKRASAPPRSGKSRR